LDRADRQHEHPGLRYLELLDEHRRADNLANKQYNSFEYITSGGLYNTGAGAALAFPGAPRTWYATLTAGF
ncbi:MAG: hypothetical protein KGL92_15025, partial [Gammaproteobacteria bacterium]|nr:hypothetical protein [Gammaproteobacteria bacterium]